jgi:hypothetical protein
VCNEEIFAVLGNGRLVVWSVKDGNRIEDISLRDRVEDGTRLKKDAVDEESDAELLIDPGTVRRQAPSSEPGDVSEITLRN